MCSRWAASYSHSRSRRSFGRRTDPLLQQLERPAQVVLPQVLGDDDVEDEVGVLQRRVGPQEVEQGRLDGPEVARLGAEQGPLEEDGVLHPAEFLARVRRRSASRSRGPCGRPGRRGR